MHFIFALAALIAALMVWAVPASAQDAPAPLVRHFFRLPATFDGQMLTLEAMEIRPRAANGGPVGRFPVAIIAHGAPGSEALRRQYKAEIFTPAAVELARRGFVAIAVLRRGFGTSEGAHAESEGPCGRSRYVEAGLESARDLDQAMRFIGAQPYADARRMVLIGQSAGGFAALALASTQAPGLLGVVSFAGGRGHFADRNSVCEPDKLVGAMAQFGRSAVAPSLWLYAENDWLFPPSLARRMAQAYRANGAPAELVMMPAFGADGHLLFVNGLAQWRGRLDEFLSRLGFPPQRRPLTVMPSAVAGKALPAFRLYVDSPLPNKAFAISASGDFAWQSGAASIDAARRDALAACRRNGALCAVVHEVHDFDDE